MKKRKFISAALACLLLVSVFSIGKVSKAQGLGDPLYPPGCQFDIGSICPQPVGALFGYKAVYPEGD